MGIQTLEFQHVSFHYPEQSIDLFSDLSLTFASGWCGVIGSNGGGKSTVLSLASGVLKPHFGTVLRPSAARYVSQRIDVAPDGYETFAAAYDGLACRLHGQLSLGRDYCQRWESLSFGERKRAQIGWALYQESDLLCIDEPTNHLDGQAIAMIVAALGCYRGIGLLVSHDLAALDALCTTTLLVSAPHVQKISCAPSQALQETDLQRRSIESMQRAHSGELRRIEAEKKRRAGIARSQDSRNTKRHIDAKDHDAKARIDAFRVSGGDKKAGSLSRQLDGRLARAQRAQHSLAEALSIRCSLDLGKAASGVTITGAVHPARTVLRLEEGSIAVAPGRRLHHPPLSLGNTERVGIRGPNGSGKSTLIRSLVAHLKEGTVRHWYLEQELGLAESTAAYQEFQDLAATPKGRIVSAVVRLGSRGDLFLASALPSPGEMRKLLIARALEEEISLLVLDEPTNHLDLPSRRALSQQLECFAGALLLVSHDQAFLDGICTTWWDLSLADGGDSTLTIN